MSLCLASAGVVKTLAVAAFLAALCLLGDFRFSDTAGFVLTALCALWQWRQRRRNAVAAA